MKYAFMTWSTPELTLDENLELAGRLGYDGIEPRIDGQQRHGVEVAADAAARRAIKHRVQDSGIELCCIATSIRYADPQIVPEQIEHTRRCIDLCGDVDSPRLRVFGGALPQDVSREQAIDGVAQALLAVAEQAQGRRVTVCIETHDDWSDPVHLAAVMEKVNHPAIAINWDFIHCYRMGRSVEESYAIVKPWIQHTHVHDGRWSDGGKLDMTWIGEGDVDHRQALSLLQSSGYSGYLSGEWINREPGYQEHLPRELATLRNYEAVL